MCRDICEICAVRFQDKHTLGTAAFYRFCASTNNILIPFPPIFAIAVGARAVFGIPLRNLSIFQRFLSGNFYIAVTQQ